MAYDHKPIEERWRKNWEEEGTYRFNPNQSSPIYSVDTPPPTVSGDLHIGHVFSYTQAEVAARYWRMNGHNVFYPFGFDDNGLPTEVLVEKELGIRARDLDRKDFINRCNEVIAKYRQKFRELWQVLGFSTDWDLEYHTISPLSQRISQRSFLELLKEGRIERQNFPALWCSECQTSVAQAEVEDKQFPSEFHNLRFKLDGGVDLPIATTRPELLPACVAVFVNPDDTRYASLVGGSAVTPLGDTVPILADPKVDLEKGTGAVMCCTYGDETDMYWTQNYQLPEKIIIEKDGTIIDVSGTKISIGDARIKMVDQLRQQGDVLASIPITHDVGVHERCKTPIEIIPVPQWFVKILGMKEKLLQVADDIEWHPPHMKARYLDWVSNLKWDWCISRQRFFGIPLPVWYSKKTGEVIVPDSEQLPIDPKVDKPKTLPPDHTYDDIEPEKDVLDTWATSSVTPEINGRWGEPNSRFDAISPMTVRPHAHDIIRTWSFYTIVKSLLHHGRTPWKHLMISGHVQAQKGEKISKSSGNARLEPMDLILQYSADAVRYWTCGAALGRDTAFDEKEIEKGRRLIIKLINASRFGAMNLKDFDHTATMDEASLEASDRWILLQLGKTAASMKQHMEQYEVGLARMEFERFFWNDFCDNYLELVKDRIYHSDQYEDGERKKQSAQYALYKALVGTLKLIAPYLPFITEEIYQNHFRDWDEGKSIHLTQQPQGVVTDETNASVLTAGMNIAQAIINASRKAKTERKLALKTEIPKTIIRATRDQIELLRPFLDDIRGSTKSVDIQLEEAEKFEFDFQLP